jgi:hypothetical protein
MLSIYTNQNDLLKATSTTEVSRLEAIDQQLLDIRSFSITFKQNTRANLELHVYTPDGIYLTGNHNALFTIEDTNTDTQLNAYKHLAINTSKELETLGINKGQYRIVYNLFDNILGGFDSQKLFIKDISPSRRELRLQLADSANMQLRGQLIRLRNRWTELEKDDIFDSFILNFGFNETYQIINFRFEFENTDTPEIFVKLYEPLPAKYGKKSKVFISEEILTPFLDSVLIIPKHVPEPITTLAGPNFNLDEYEGGSVATSFKSWNDLLSTNVSTSQQIIDNYFSGSLSGIQLNIDYRYFDNFIHYSSAVERVKNFKYKLELIEYYTSQIQSVLNISGSNSAINANLSDLYSKRNKVVSVFDNFEKYLFFETTGSTLYTFYNVSSSYGITSSINPWPKSTSTANYTWATAYELWSAASSLWNADPYEYFSIQQSVNSDVATEYYNNLLEIASIYDKFNIHKLQNTIPSFIQDSEDAQYVLFINMIAQHFDILWTYIKNLTTIHTREEHPKDGMPNDLLHHVASSMGFDLLNGKSASELWRYSLGVDENGTALQNDVNGINSLSDETNTKEIWRRLVNNLPYILKSKGTSRSIKALLACFGIPSTILTIKEYGGPSTFTDNDQYPEYVHNVYHYAWNSISGSLLIPSKSYINANSNVIYPDVLEFRFKTEDSVTYTSGSTYIILQTSGSTLSLTKETSTDNQGTLTYSVNGQSGSLNNLEIFDNSWHQIALTNLHNSSASLQVVKSLYGKTVYNSSSFFRTGSGLFTTSENIYFATGSNKFIGHFQEIRLWSGSINSNSLEEHAASPSSYTYNVDRINNTNGSQGDAPYKNLLNRFTLTSQQIQSSSGQYYQISTHPNQTINTGSIYFNQISSSSQIIFDAFEETYYTPSPSLGGSSLYTNKVRIESASLDSNKRLNTKTRIEKSSFDRYSIDSNRLGVYFSPQTAINEDIFNQLGYFEIDDYIGNPGDVYSDHYTDLNNFAIQYWKKYDNRNDFEAYFRALQIYDFTLFKYIKQLLPQRANSIIGLVIEPNVLERSKVKLLNKPVIEDLVKNAYIEKYQLNIASEYNLIEGAAISYSPDVYSNYESLQGLISTISSVNILDTHWSQHRYIGKYKITESGSYYPTSAKTAPYGNSNRIINHGRIDLQLRDGKLPYIPTNMDAINNITASYNTRKSASINLPNGPGNYQITFLGAYDADPDYLYVYNSLNQLIQAILVDSVSYGSYTSSFFSYTPDIILSDYYGGSYGYGVFIDSLKFQYQNYPEVNLNKSTGHLNSKFNGSKLSGAGINIDSPSTVDGGPVVKVIKTNPNQIVFSNNQITTIDQSVTGVQSKSL